MIASPPCFRRKASRHATDSRGREVPCATCWSAMVRRQRDGLRTATNGSVWRAQHFPPGGSQDGVDEVPSRGPEFAKAPEGLALDGFSNANILPQPGGKWEARRNRSGGCATLGVWHPWLRCTTHGVCRGLG